ncbi:MAG TPA: hydrogenase maturation nickel metallochaperone HypA [Candidatus Dormibacteraeota bacterium]|nr:hydrogenase maturation nickel metallochaperone HypA [Candidatus Dormibacteraeota bacterium]
MHELSIAANLVESVLQFVSEKQPSEVRAVRLAVGELTCVQHEQLRFCYQSLVGQTEIKGSALEIETVPAEVSCSHCQYEGAPRYWDEALAVELVPTLQCPQCGKAAEAVRGHECAIRSIQYVS